VSDHIDDPAQAPGSGHGLPAARRGGLVLLLDVVEEVPIVVEGVLAAERGVTQKQSAWRSARAAAAAAAG